MTARAFFEKALARCRHMPRFLKQGEILGYALSAGPFRNWASQPFDLRREEK
jgi:hypothetical protein